MLAPLRENRGSAFRIRAPRHTIRAKCFSRNTRFSSNPNVHTYALFNQDKNDLRPYANPGLLVVLGFLFVCKKRNETPTLGIIYVVKLKHKRQIQPCRLKKGALRVFRQLICYEVSSSSQDPPLWFQKCCTFCSRNRTRALNPIQQRPDRLSDTVLPHRRSTSAI